MATYTDLATGVLLSALPAAVNDRFAAARSLERGGNAAEPPVKVAGLVWNRTDYPALGDALLRWSGSAWTLLADPEFACLNAGGTVAAAADLPMGNNKLTGLAAGTASGHSVRYEQVVLRTGGQLSGPLDANGEKITALGAPAAGTDAARLQDTAPVAGSFSLVTPSNQNQSNLASVELGFVPSAIVLTFADAASAIQRNRAPWTPLVFVPAAVGVTQYARPDVLDVSGSFVRGALADGLGSARFDLTRRSSSPNGFEFQRANVSTIGATAIAVTHTINYLAFR